MTEKELEKIVINSEEELKALKGQDLNGKHIILKISGKNIKLGTLEECIIEGDSISCKKLSGCNIYNVKYVYADEIYLSFFQGCRKVRCGGIVDSYNIKASRFFDCGEISIDDAVVEDCIFDNFEIMLLTEVAMDNCIMANIVCEEDYAISMEDGELTNISFENIELKNDSYLIEGYGIPWVENSVFVNIRTSREDFEIFHMEETKGFIFKKTKEYCFVDEDTCSGLDLIPVVSNLRKGDTNE